MEQKSEDIQFKLARVLLRPVLKFCLARAIGFKAISLLIKEVLLELAADELERKEEKVTLSRLQIMTGIDRREVTRLRRSEELPGFAPHPVKKVLACWERECAYLSASGRPRTLSCGGDDSEFSSLVNLVSGDLNPAAMLSELKRMGAVSVSKRGVKMVGDVGVVSYKDPERLMGLLSRNIEVLSRVAEENLSLDDEERHLHLRTEYDNLSVEDMEAIKVAIARKGGSFHKDLRKLLFEYDQDLTPVDGKKGGGRAVVCSFAWTESEEGIEEV